MPNPEKTAPEHVAIVGKRLLTSQHIYIHFCQNKGSCTDGITLEKTCAISVTFLIFINLQPCCNALSILSTCCAALWRGTSLFTPCALCALCTLGALALALNLAWTLVALA
jgi:hypothetical protein